MGEIADDIVAGRQCSGCGILFEGEHGYPVLCESCWADTPRSDRAGLQKATIEEIG